jgi:5,10-methylenetetrahydromethanopterin reductase
MSCATIDRLSEGRFVLGLGRNSPATIQGQLGIPYGRPLAIMDEMARVLRALWRGESVTSSGYYHLAGVALDVPGPRARLPIYLGVSGPAGLRCAGRMADGVLLQGFQTPAYVRWAVEQIQRGAAEAGRDAAEVDVGMILFGFQITDDPSERASALKPLAALLLALPYYEQQFIRNGFDPEVRKALQRALKIDQIVSEGREPYLYALREGDVAEAVSHISDDMIRAMCIVGTEAECRRRLDAYREAGLAEIVLNYGITYDMPIAQDIPTSVRYLAKLRSWWLS